MDMSIEEKFVNAFVLKNKRKRVLHELGSAKKRALAIQRLYNSVDKSFVIFDGSNLSDDELIAETKKRFKSNQECYIISEISDDGKMLPFEEALKNMLRYEVSYAIIYDDKTTIISEEYDTFRRPSKLILYKN